MNAIEWLETNAYGFAELSSDERHAMMHFSLLWSLFEARALNTRGNAQSIVNAVNRWAEQGLLAEDPFEAQLAYFRNRYYASGAFTHHFYHLHLRRNDHPDLVESVLTADSTDPADITAALLIIVYRFRNNLLHGVKWAYHIQGQLENFRHANAILMRAIELHDRSGVL